MKMKTLKYRVYAAIFQSIQDADNIYELRYKGLDGSNLIECAWYLCPDNITKDNYVLIEIHKVK